MAKKAEQEGMFVEDQIGKLTAKIELKHKEVKETVELVSEFGEFFKLLPKWLGSLDGAQTDTADDLALDNIRFALTRSSALADKLKLMEERLVECRLLANEIETLRKENGI